jgi:hypothetical protein
MIKTNFTLLFLSGCASLFNSPIGFEQSASLTQKIYLSYADHFFFMYKDFKNSPAAVHCCRIAGCCMRCRGKKGLINMYIIDKHLFSSLLKLSQHSFIFAYIIITLILHYFEACYYLRLFYFTKYLKIATFLKPFSQNIHKLSL